MWDLIDESAVERCLNIQEEKGILYVVLKDAARPEQRVQLHKQPVKAGQLNDNYI